MRWRTYTTQFSVLRLLIAHAIHRSRKVPVINASRKELEGPCSRVKVGLVHCPIIVRFPFSLVQDLVISHTAASGCNVISLPTARSFLPTSLATVANHR